MTDEIDLAETMPDGKTPRYIETKNQAIYDRRVGHIIRAPKTGLITAETSRLMLARKHEIAQHRAAEAIDEAAIEAGRIPKSAATGEGWRAVVRHVTATLLESKNLRGQAEAANFLAKASGLAAPEAPSVAFAEVLVSLLERHLGADVVEGKVIDAADR